MKKSRQSPEHEPKMTPGWADGEAIVDYTSCQLKGGGISPDADAMVTGRRRGPSTETGTMPRDALVNSRLKHLFNRWVNPRFLESSML